MGGNHITNEENKYPHEEITGALIKAAFAVHNNLGPGFREIVYQRALALELPQHGLEFSREVGIPIYYRESKIGQFRVDFVVDDVMAEIKAKSEIEDVAIIQTLSYLRASDYEVGVILILSEKNLQIKRLDNSKENIFDSSSVGKWIKRSNMLSSNSVNFNNER